MKKITIMRLKNILIMTVLILLIAFGFGVEPVNAATYTFNTGGITVMNAAGISTTSSSDQFTYIAAPTVSSVSPSAGATAGGTTVTITGTNFTGASAVIFGSTNASFTVNSATQITATAPAGSAGTIDITVTTAGGTSATSASDQFTYIAAPMVSGVSTNAGSTAGGTTVTITGTNFTGASAVMFGSTYASFTVNSATQITATAPAGSAGTIDITVTTAGGTSATSASDRFTYIAVPTVSSVSPSAGPTTGGTTVTITGTNFTGVSAVKFGSTNASGFTVYSATHITATAPAGSAGTIDITVTTTGGTSASSASDQFTYIAAPTVSSVSPSAGPTAGGTTVTITGTNFSAVTAVNFGSTNATGYTVNSATQITATAPAGSAGTVDITVTTAGGTSASSASVQFTYIAAPTVSSVSPSAGPTAGGTTVTITGTNFTGVSAVEFGSTNATGYTVNSATQITATAPAGNVGTVDITVTTAGGTSASSASDQFTYIAAPTVSSVSPSAGPTTGGTTVTITGTNFLGASSVKFGSTNATGFIVNSATHITAVAPAGTVGMVDITVTTAEGTSASSAREQFTYIAAPTVSGVSPSAGPTTGGTTVTITGTNITGASTVMFGSTNATSYTVNSATQITATAPAGSAGTVDITVTTVGGTSASSASDQFTYKAAPSSGSGNSGSTSNKGSNGLITIEQQKDERIPDTNLNNTTEDLKETLFTKEELSKIEAGENAKVILKVTDISSSVSEVDKKLIAEKLVGDTSVIYIDLSLYKKIGSGTETKITETTRKISINIEVPVELRSTDMTKNRTYQIVRIHDGEVSILKGVYDSGTNIFSFETDRFSTYALTYEDTNVDPSAGKGEDIVTVTKDFFSLRLRATATENSQKLTYNKISGADGYIIYGALCGTNNKSVKLADVSGKITSYNHKNLNKAAYYKYQVRAYKLLNGKKVVISISKVIHSVTISKTYDNPIKIKSDTSAVILTLGKTKKVACQVVLPKSKKMSNHTDAVQFETSNNTIATVSSSGKIKGKAKGTCYVYAYAQNGVYKKIKVTVE